MGRWTQNTVCSKAPRMAVQISQTSTQVKTEVLQTWLGKFKSHSWFRSGLSWCTRNQATRSYSSLLQEWPKALWCTGSACWWPVPASGWAKRRPSDMEARALWCSWWTLAWRPWTSFNLSSKYLTKKAKSKIKKYKSTVNSNVYNNLYIHTSKKWYREKKGF